LFVALTRAEEDLSVSWCGPFPLGLEPLAQARAHLLAAPPPDEQRRRLRELSSLLAAS
jgi:hypothetical protein